MEKICPYCEKQFWKRPSHADRKYCSKKCYLADVHNEANYKNCLVCDKTYKIRTTIEVSKYCCDACRRQGMAVDKFTKPCQQCGEEYEVYARDKDGSKYCSAACKREATTKLKTCPICEIEFRVRNSHYDQRVYCSGACEGQAYKIRYAGSNNPNFRNSGQRICEGCGEEFYYNKGKKKYCTRDCYLRHRLPDFMNRFTGYTQRRVGKRDDLDGTFFRSSWEANYARYLNWLIKIGQISNWEYEVDTFEFTAIKKGTRFYIPDFKVTNLDGSIEYHEVKGWMDPRSQTKLKRMKRYYPKIKLVLIDKVAYKALEKDVKRFIIFWE